MTDPSVQRLIGLLESTPTGQGLIGGVVVLTSSGGERTDTAGVPRFAANVYVDGATIILQVFDFDAQAWRSVTLT